MALRRRLGSERGVALPVAMGVLLILSIFAGVALSSSVHSSEYAIQDANARRALAAAQTGLETAIYRVNKLHPDFSHCVTNIVTLPNDPSGECVRTESAANGTSFTFYVTTGGAECASLPGAPDPAGTLRCVTSTGTAGSVTRRIEARIIQTQITPPLLPVHGMWALASVSVGNNGKLQGDVGSNGPINFGTGSVITGEAQVGPASSYTGPTPLGGVIAHSPFVLQPVPIANTETANNNSVLTAAEGYDAATRSLILNGPLTLPPGDYNFCRLDFVNQYSISASGGGVVRIFVDAPDSVRPGSGCPENAPTSGILYGTVNGKNGISLNPGGDPSALQLYVNGWDPNGTYANLWGQNTIDTGKNTLDMNALLFAPSTNVTVGKNVATLDGALYAYTINLKNNLTMNWDTNLSHVGEQTGTATRVGWFECEPSPPSGGSPQSGC